MYIVTETAYASHKTDVRGVFENRTVYDRNIDYILDKAAMNSTVKVYTGKANSYLPQCRFIESFRIKIVPEARKAVRIK